MIKNPTRTGAGASFSYSHSCLAWWWGFCGVLVLASHLQLFFFFFFFFFPGNQSQFCFSLFVCFVFWFVSHLEMALLVQRILMTSLPQSLFLPPLNNNNFITNPRNALSLLPNLHNPSTTAAAARRRRRRRLLVVSKDPSNETDNEIEDDDDDEPKSNDPYSMDKEERREWRSKIRQVMSNIEDDVEEEIDLDQRRKKMQELVSQYPLVVEEDDPDWPEDADGWGFNLGRFFDKITIKNNPKKQDSDDDDDDDDGYDSERNEIVWQDDNYILPIRDITTSDWEHTVFKDISPLIVLVHNRYKRPKENEKIRDQLEKAVQIIWNCGLPSPRCVAVDAVVETDLVSALKVSVFPEMIYTKAGKILFRDKAIRSADELSKIMAFFYYGATKPPCLKTVGDTQEVIPSVPVNSPS